MVECIGVGGEILQLLLMQSVGNHLLPLVKQWVVLCSYVSLRILGVGADDPCCLHAREWVSFDSDLRSFAAARLPPYAHTNSGCPAYLGNLGLCLVISCPNPSLAVFP